MIKRNFIYNGYETSFNGVGSSYFANGFAKNVLIFGVGSTSSDYSTNSNNNYGVLRKVSPD